MLRGSADLADGIEFFVFEGHAKDHFGIVITENIDAIEG